MQLFDRGVVFQDDVLEVGDVRLGVPLDEVQHLLVPLDVAGARLARRRRWRPHEDAHTDFLVAL